MTDNKIPIEVTVEEAHALAFGCRRINLDAYPAAWGARAICRGDGFVDLLQDRMDAFGSQADKDRLFAHLNEVLPRPVLNDKAGRIQGNDDTVHLIHEDDVVKVVASAQKSYGYVYITAVLKEGA